MQRNHHTSAKLFQTLSGNVIPRQKHDMINKTFKDIRNISRLHFFAHLCFLFYCEIRSEWEYLPALKIVRIVCSLGHYKNLFFLCHCLSMRKIKCLLGNFSEIEARQGICQQANDLLCVIKFPQFNTCNSCTGLHQKPLCCWLQLLTWYVSSLTRFLKMWVLKLAFWKTCSNAASSFETDPHKIKNKVSKRHFTRNNSWLPRLPGKIKSLLQRLRVSLTVSLSCPSACALWPNRTSAVSWKHVTHWLSPKSAKLA